MKILEQIKGWLESNSSVQRVAEDLQLTSELILLVRMIFADGKMKLEELENFKRICKIAFDIPEKDVPEVIRYLQEFGYETTVDDAAIMFSELDDERKRTLLLHLLSVAKSDNELQIEEVDLLRRTAEVLGMSAENIAQFKTVT